MLTRICTIKTTARISDIDGISFFCVVFFGHGVFKLQYYETKQTLPHGTW